MTAVADLDLPELDLSDPGLKGERWHETMNGLLADGHWLARGPLATVILDREAGEHFLRSRSAVFGAEIGHVVDHMARRAHGPLGPVHIGAALIGMAAQLGGVGEEHPPAARGGQARGLPVFAALPGGSVGSVAGDRSAGSGG